MQEATQHQVRSSEWMGELSQAWKNHALEVCLQIFYLCCVIFLVLLWDSWCSEVPQVSPDDHLKYHQWYPFHWLTLLKITAEDHCWTLLKINVTCNQHVHKMRLKVDFKENKDETLYVGQPDGSVKMYHHTFSATWAAAAATVSATHHQLQAGIFFALAAKSRSNFQALLPFPTKLASQQKHSPTWCVLYSLHLKEREGRRKYL